MGSKVIKGSVFCKCFTCGGTSTLITLEMWCEYPFLQKEEKNQIAESETCVTDGY